MPSTMTCTNPTCFFCTMKEQNILIRSQGIKKCFKEILLINSQERVLILSSLWNTAMNQPNDPEFPSLGIFKCMVRLLHKSIKDKSWLLDGQNIYIPYYAAHIIGSYTMNKIEFAEKAVESGVIPPLLDLLKGCMSWVEQRVAVRALGHLASYDSTFEKLAVYEEDVVRLSMGLASKCDELVYNEFVAVKDANERVKYHKKLMTRGVGGLEIENQKAEEWASQIQCWSLHLLNCFAVRGKSIDVICDNDFLKDLSLMWGGLVNHTSPSGVGLIRILCYTRVGRRKISECHEVIKSICNLARSSDDWQYMGIDCLILLLHDMNTRYKVFEFVSFYLVDLTEVRTLGERSKIGEKITKALLIDFKNGKSSRINNPEVDKILKEVWVTKVEKKRRERLMSDEKLEEKRVLVSLMKQQANHSFWLGDIESAVMKYTEALEVCPLRLLKERIVLYSNRAQCYLLLNNPDKAISDTTRALSISKPVNSHAKSLWRRSQAYYVKGLAKESLMDCLMFVNAFVTQNKRKHAKIPYYAVHMIKKQMDSICFFASAKLKVSHLRSRSDPGKTKEELTDDEELLAGLYTILEEPMIGKDKDVTRRKMRRRYGRRKNSFMITRSI